MATSFKPICTLFVLFLVICSNRVLLVSEARPLKLGNSWSSSSIESSSLFDIDELYIEAMKITSGKGHGFTNSQTLGGIKNGGPSSGGKGYALTNSHTALGLGGIKKSGPSAGGRGN